MRFAVFIAVFIDILKKSEKNLKISLIMSIILKELRGSRYNYFAHLKCAGKILWGLMRELVYGNWNFQIWQ